MRKQGKRVPVITHTKQNKIESKIFILEKRPKHFGIFFSSNIWFNICSHDVHLLFWNIYVVKQSVKRHFCIVSFIIKRNNSFISPKNINAFPVNLVFIFSRCEFLVQYFWCAST